MPEKSLLLNVSSYQTCISFDGHFIEETVKLRCTNRMYGRYVVIYIPGKQYLTLCEVQIFGDRGKLIDTYYNYGCTFGQLYVHDRVYY